MESAERLPIQVLFEKILVQMKNKESVLDLLINKTCQLSVLHHDFTAHNMLSAETHFCLTHKTQQILYSGDTAQVAI